MKKKGKQTKSKFSKETIPVNSKWFNNVAKSLGYASMDIIKDVVPSIYEMTTENVASVNDIIEGFRDNASSENIISQSMNKVSPLLKISNKAMSNVLEDIKSGDFYNKSRSDQITDYYNKMADDDMFDFDDEDFSFGDDFGDDDFDEDDMFNFDEDNDAEVIVKPTKVVSKTINHANVLPAAKAISDLNAQNTLATVSAVKGLGDQERIFEVQRVMRDAEFNQVLFGTLGSINENLSNILMLKTENEEKFFSVGLSFFGEQIDLMTKLLEVQKGDDRTPEEIKDDDRAKNTKSSKPNIFLTEGGLDLSAYVQNIFSNLKEMDEFEDYFTLAEELMGSDMEDLEQLVAAPLRFIPKAIINHMVPGLVKDSLNLIDTSISSFTGAFVAKLNAWAEGDSEDDLVGGIKSFIGRLFGYNPENKQSAILGEYEKGEVPFDGITRKTIVDVIPTYLRRIESAITNSAERVYDYDTGRFQEIDEMKKSYDKQMNNLELGGQMEIMNRIDKALRGLNLTNDQEDSFRRDVIAYFKAMNDKGAAINPFTRTDAFGNEIDDLYDNDLFEENPENKELFRRILLTFDKPSLMRMMGSNIFSSIDKRTKQYYDIEADPTIMGYKYFNDNSIKESDYTEDEFGARVRKRTFPGSDKYGLTVLDYARDIRSILLNGLTVFIGGQSSIDTDPNNAIRARVDRENRTYETEANRTREFNAQREVGRRDVNDVIRLDDSELSSLMKLGETEEEARSNRLFLDSLRYNSRGPLAQVRDDLRDGLVGITSKAANNINNFLYRIIFGDESQEGDYVDNYLDLAKTKLSAFHSWVIFKVYEPVKDAFIGENGIITKLKNSPFYKNLVEKKNILIDKLLGIKDEAGNRIGGLFSTARNKVVDFFKAVRHSFTGKSYTDSEGNVIHEDPDAMLQKIKRGSMNLFNQSKDYLMGKDGKPGLIKEAYTSFMDGMNSFKETIFGKSTLSGYKGAGHESMKEFFQDIKGKLPKAFGRGLIFSFAKFAFASKLGVFGSLFMPGGVLGSILSGTVLSLVTQSETFKKWAFGEEDPENPGRRMGGFIPKKLQDFYHENKIQLGIGAGAGVITSFFLPGGPIFGALMGMGSVFVSKTDAFQEFLYGPDFANGDKKLMNGFFGRAYSRAKDTFDKYGIDPKLATFLGGIGAGAGALGLIPSFFLPGGPIGGALLGMAGGIAASSDRFQTWLFGEKEFDGKRSGGLIDKFKTFFDIEVLDSFKITMKEWNLKISDFLYDSVAEPFLAGIEPMKQILIDAAHGVKNMFSKGWNFIKENVLGVFKDNVIKPFGESLNKYVVSPLKKMLRGTFGLLGKFIGGVISAPFKIFGWLGNRADTNATTEEEKAKRDKVKEAREAREAKRQERRDQVQAEINELKENQKKDREFFKRDGRFRNEKQKEKWETEQKEKQLFYQQHIAESGAEAADKLDEINQAITSIESLSPKILYSLEENILKELRYLRDVAKDQLSYFRTEGYVDTRYLRREKEEAKPIEPTMFDRQMWLHEANTKAVDEIKQGASGPTISSYLKNDPSISNEAKKNQDPTVNSVISILRKYGQSHDEGLSMVPYDGYVAELHKGERIIPSTQADDPMKVIMVGGYLDGIRNIQPASATEIDDDGLEVLKKIKSNTKTTANIADDNLHGVGWNLHHIRKMLQYITGLNEADTEKINDVNLSGGLFSLFFGRVKRGFSGVFDFISKPFKGLFNLVTAPFKWLGKTVHKLADTVVNVVNKFLEIPGKIIGTVMDVASNVIKGASKILFQGLELGLKGVTTVVSDLYKGSRWLVTTIAKNFVPMITGAGKLIGAAFSGIAKTVGVALDAVAGLGKGIYTVTKDIIGFTYKFGRDLLKGAWNIGRDLAKGIWNVGKSIISAPFKFIGNLFGKVTKQDIQRVEIIGGKLDTVKVVETVKNFEAKLNIEQDTEENNTRSSIVKMVKDFPSTVKSSIIEGFEKIKDQFGINKETGEELVDNVVDTASTTQEPSPLQMAGVSKSVKQEYEDQISERKKQAEKEEDDKKDLQEVRRKTSDYMKEEKAKQEKEKLLTTYHSETMSDIDSTEKILNKQYDFWYDLFGKNGKVSTFLSNLWETIKTVAPLLFNWFKGTTLGKAMGGLFNSLFGGLGLKDLIANAVEIAAPALVGLLIDNLDKKERDERAEKYNLTDTEAYLGVGKESRYAGEEEGYILNGSRLEHKGKLYKNLYRDALNKNIPNRIYNAGKEIGTRAWKLGKTGVEKGKTAANTVKNTVSNIKSKFGFGGTSVADDAANGLIEVMQAEVLDADGKTIQGVTASFVNVADDVATENKGLVRKFLSMLDDAIKKAVEFIGGKLGNSKLISKIDDVVKPIISKLTGKIDDIILKYTPKIASFLGITSAGTATAFILDAGFAIWDVATGQTKSETANLFGVKPEQVNGRMRIISAALKALGKFSWIEVVYLANEIAADLLDVNLIRWLAGLIYKLVASDEEAAQLSANQDAMEAEWKAYNEANGTNLSKEAFIDMQAPTVFEKMINSKAVQAIAKPFKSSTIGNALGKDADDVTWGDRFKYWGGGIVNGFMNIFRSDENDKTMSEFFGNGKLKTDEHGNVITDENGNPTYYTEDELSALYGENAGMGDIDPTTGKPKKGFDWSTAFKTGLAGTLAGGPMTGLATGIMAGNPQVQEYFRNLADKASEWLGFEIDDSKGVLGNLSEGFKALKGKIQAWWTRDDDDINKALGKDEDAKVTNLQRKGWGVVKAFNWAANFFRDEEKELTAVEEFEKIKETFTNIGKNIWEWLGKRLENVKNIMTTIKDGFSAVKDVVSGWLGLAEEEVEKSDENDESWGNKITTSVKNGWSRVKSFFGFNAYEQGTPWVPDTQVALIHEGEMIVPAEYNPLANSLSTTIGENEWVAPEAAYTMEEDEMVIPDITDNENMKKYFENYLSPVIEPRVEETIQTPPLTTPTPDKNTLTYDPNNMQITIGSGSSLTVNGMSESFDRLSSNLTTAISGINVTSTTTAPDYSAQLDQISNSVVSIDNGNIALSEAMTKVGETTLKFAEEEQKETGTKEPTVEEKPEKSWFTTQKENITEKLKDTSKFNLKNALLTNAITGPFLSTGVGLLTSDQGKEWVGEQKDKVVEGYNYTKDKVIDGYNYTKDKVVEGYNYTKDKVVEGYNYTKDKVIDGYNYTKDKVIDGYNYTKDKVIDGYNYTKDKVIETKDKIVDAYYAEDEQAAMLNRILSGDKTKEATHGTRMMYDLSKFTTKLYNLNPFIDEENKLSEEEGAALLADNIKSKILEPIEKAKGIVVEKFNEMKESATKWIDETKTKVVGFYNEKIKEPIEKAKGVVFEKYEELKESATKWIEESKTKVIDFYNNNVKEPISKAKGALVKKISDMKTSATKWIEESKTKVIDFYNTNVKEPIAKAKGAVLAKINETKESAKAWIEESKTKVIDFYNTKIKEPIANAKGALVKKISDMKESAKAWIGETKEKVIDFYQENIKEPLSKLGGKAKQKLDDMTNSVKNWVNDVKNKAIDAFNKYIKDPFLGIFGGGDGGAQNKQDAQQLVEENMGTGSESVKPLSQQIKPKNYVFNEQDNRYSASDVGTTVGRLRDKGNTHNFPYYSQLDSRWGREKLIGQSTIGRSGCGPTAAAMVLTHLTGEYITPDTMARVGEGHLPGYASYSYFPEVARKFRLNYDEIGRNDSANLVAQLKTGQPVILSGFDSSNSSYSPYTNEGHIVVATGMDGSYVQINDPRGPAYSGSYHINDIMRGLKQGIVYKATGQTADIGLPSSGVYNENAQMIGDYDELEAVPYDPFNPLGSTGEGQVTVADRVLSYARAFLANTSKFKYSQAQNNTTGRYGIDHNNIGADCSSFVSHVISVAGDTGKIAYLSQSFWDSAGTKVDPPQIGDVVCQQGHVGLYSGDGNYIHMSGRKHGIKESKAIQRGNNPHRGYKRVLKNPSAMVDPTIVGGNSLLGTVVATSSGNPVTSGGAPGETPLDTTGGGSAPQVNELGVFDQLSLGMSSIIASMYNGKLIDLSAQSSSGGTTPGGTTPGGSTPVTTGTGSFPKYNLNDAQIKGIANILQHEQPGIEGRYAEASLMANLVDKKGDEYATTDNLIKKATGGWFAKGKERFNNPGNPEQISIDAVKSVLVEGKRTLPRYVDEHDCFSDLTSVTNNGASFKASDRSQYKPHVTKIKNRYGASGTFYTFPNSKSDPFYYTSEELRTKWGEDHYSVGGSVTTIDDNAGAGWGDIGPLSTRELVNLYGDNAGMDPAETTTTGGTTPGGIPTSMNNFAYYKQSDPTWNASLINGHSIADGGCGPTTLAMIATQLSGKIITPVTMAKAAEKAGHWKGFAYWSLFDWFGEKFGLNTKVIGSNDLKTAKSELAQGKVIAISGKTVKKGSHTPYTSGHIVPFIGLDGSNKIIVNDSRGPEHAHAYEDSGLAQGTTNHMRQGWAYSGQIKIPSDIEVSGDYTGGGGTTGPQASLDKVLLIGDSLTVGMKPVLEGKYPNAKAMGKGGKWAKHWLESLGELPDPESVGTVIQWLGINGVHTNESNMKDSQTLLTKLKEKYSSVPIFNMRIFPTTQDYSYGDYKGDWWKGLSEEFNTGMSTWASSNGVQTMDATSGMIQSDGYLDPSKAVDGIHFTTEGYNQVLANMEGGVTSYNNNLGNGTPGSGGGGSASQVNELGVFDQLSMAMSSVIASMYNGRLVDLSAQSSSGGTSPGTSPGSTPGQDISGISDYEQAVWTYFTSRGYTPQATAGIMGNMYQESGVNPTAIQGGGKGPAAGICQWENINTGGARWGILKKYADSKGVDWKDLQTQLEYLEMELTGDQSKIAVDTYTSTLVKKRGGIETLKSMTDAIKAMYFFEETFERAGKPNYPRREKAVKDYLARFGGNAGTGGLVIPVRDTIFSNLNDNVYYSQADSQWNNVSYSGNMLSNAGCGPTSLAMIASQLTGKHITPDLVAQAAHEDGVWSDSSSWDIFPWFAQQLGLEYKVSGMNQLDELNALLGAKYSVVASGKLHERAKGRTPFTTQGHIVPILGLQNNKYLINDPRGKEHSGLYAADELVNGNSVLRAAYGYKTTSKTVDYLANSRFNPELLKQFTQEEPEIEPGVSLGDNNGKQYNASELYKNAGLGEVTSRPTTNIVHTYKPETVAKVSKPISDINMDILSSLKSKIGPDQQGTIANDSEMTYIKACLESLNVAVQELKSINENTRQTAENVSNIQIYSANEPISTGKMNLNDKESKLKNTKPIQKSKQMEVLNTEEYKIARIVASFRK